MAAASRQGALQAEQLAGDAPDSLSQKAYRKLLDMMVSGKLPANTPLQERRISEVLSISRTPVREALSRLESEGLVTRQAGRFPVVRQSTVEEVIEALNVRKLLEVEASGLAAGKLEAVQAARVRAAIHELMSSPSPTVAQHWAVDDMVHGMIGKASGNRVLTDIVRDLRLRTHMFDMRMLPERFRPGCMEHLAIIDVIEAGDAAEARAAMGRHLDNVKQSILDKLQRL